MSTNEIGIHHHGPRNWSRRGCQGNELEEDVEGLIAEDTQVYG